MKTNLDNLNGDPKIIQLRDLGRQVESLAKKAKLSSARYPSLADLDWLERALHRFSSKFTVTVIGQVSSGKSSFINSLLGRKILLPSDKPTDGVVSVLMATAEGANEYAEKILKDGSIVQFDSLGDATRFLRQQETPVEEQLACREVRLYLNEPWLRHLRIVNTPGLGDRLLAFEKTALQYLQEDESDLVVWTFFPESTANESEVGIFSDALSRRRGSVLGVVTRCCEGKEHDVEYDPKKSPSFVGEHGVVPWLIKRLGEYLGDIILYDSSLARRLVREMRDDPQLQSDPGFNRDLERSGYAHFQKVLGTMLGPERERIREAQTISILKRCSSHAANLATVSGAANSVFLQQANLQNDHIDSWKKVEKEIIGPSRVCLKDEIRSLAQERSKEMVRIMGNSAANAIQDNFNLLTALARFIGSTVRLCRPADDVLNEKISKSIEAGIIESKFNERLTVALQDIVEQQLRSIQSHLDDLTVGGGSSEFRGGVPGDSSRYTGGTSDVLVTALSGASKALVTAISKSIVKKLEELAAAKAAQKAAEETGKKAATVAAGKAAAGAAKGGLAKAAGVVSLIMLPFDIAKLREDFLDGKQNIIGIVRAGYEADRPLYEIRLFDALWPIAKGDLEDLLKDARSNLGERQGVRKDLLESAQDAESCQRSFEELSKRILDSARD